ncbi:MAG: penicillin-binding transpeptidase domain-containing protein [Crocinitomicaceae bacterium]|nr:penicillin-binding transpeptidase domain-containing protein [Crocinitomicaceae bacterium]MDG1777155.1 penicillin-binding transpeptidase domain-containing protein [Crocinitomicaceae bacterium]
MKFEGRKYVILSIFILIGILYAFKLFYMQVIDDTWKLRAQKIAEKRREITPPRAIVFDRDGKKVVSNKTYYNLMMVEKNIDHLDTLAFSKLIGWTVQEVKDRFIAIVKGEGTYYNRHSGKTTSNYQKRRAYPFIKELSAEEISRIAPHLENFKGFYEEVSSMRHYPYANGANILGYLSEVTQPEIDNDKFYKPGGRIGRSGIERYYESQFRGEKGVKYIVTSAMNNTIGSFEDGKYDTIAKQSPPIQLGLDVLLQSYGEKLLKNKKGCIVAIEPNSGEILAMVSSPNYDPNLLVGNRKIRKNYPGLLKNKDKPLFPRPLASEYMPGSTFKLIQSLIGMQEGVITKNSGFPCNKSMVGCHDHPSARNVAEAVKMSCNPYYYAVVRRIIEQGKKSSSFKDAEIGLNVWAKYMRSFGLGKRLNADITGIRSGLIPDSKYYDKWYGHNKWKFSTIRSISIGQGEVQLTPLQLANVAAIIANRGWYYTPHFVKSIGDQGPLERFTVKHKTMVDPVHFTSVIEGMKSVVHDQGGTARKAYIDGITVCGKTGTVENYIGKIKQPNHSAFIAFAPMNNPKISISVFIENAGGGGGTWAAPIASLMIEHYLTGEVKSIEKEKRILDARLPISK